MICNISENIKEIRTRHKLSQEELANRLGVSRVTVTRYENQQKTFDIDTIENIAKALNVTPYDILEDNKKAEVFNRISKYIEEDSIDTIETLIRLGFSLNKLENLSKDEIEEVDSFLRIAALVKLSEVISRRHGTQIFGICEYGSGESNTLCDRILSSINDIEDK